MISAQTDYLTRQARASYQVETPDPYLDFPELGQRLIIHWSLPNRYQYQNDLSINVFVRFHNNTEKTLSFPIHKLSGTHMYAFTGQDYIETQGIATYKIQILQGECPVSEWRHQLWVEFITVSDDTKTANSPL